MATYREGGPVTAISVTIAHEVRAKVFNVPGVMDAEGREVLRDLEGAAGETPSGQAASRMFLDSIGNAIAGIARKVWRATRWTAAKGAEGIMVNVIWEAVKQGWPQIEAFLIQTAGTLAPWVHGLKIALGL